MVCELSLRYTDELISHLLSHRAGELVEGGEELLARDAPLVGERGELHRRPLRLLGERAAKVPVELV